MQKLNLPEFHFRLMERQGVQFVFDEFRSKWVVVTPEEWVRQNFLRYLSDYKGFPKSLMSVEKKVNINGLSQRFDLLIFDRKGLPLLVAEFKAPVVAVNQEAFDQVLRYNGSLMAPYVIISNGLFHFISRIDFDSGSAEYLKEIPDYAAI
jgi:type I site-specific restriction-modification system R (restriction) subunit